MKELKETAREFSMVYGSIIAAMLVFAGAAAMDGHENGAVACAGIAAIFVAMYAVTIALTAAIELIKGFTETAPHQG